MTVVFREEDGSKLSSMLAKRLKVFIHGPFGSGKTTLIKSLLLSIGSAVYVDCTLSQTTNSILRDVLSQVSPLKSILSQTLT